MSMKIAVMQPYIFPYLGYFQLVNAVDTFVFYDDVNFKKKGYINRNSILVNGKAFRFTIPCKEASQNKLIKDVELDFDIKKKDKFLKSLRLAYKKAPYFDEIFSLIESFFVLESNTFISNLAISSVEIISKYLEIKTNFKISSEDFNDIKTQNKEDRLIEISKKQNAKNYVNLIGGKNLYNKDYFSRSNINLYFVQQNAISYDQLNHDFISNLSIIDVLMFNSKDETKKLLNQYTLL